MEELTITFKERKVDEYIARVLNEQHPEFPAYVRGIKEFIEWVKNPALHPALRGSDRQISGNKDESTPTVNS